MGGPDVVVQACNLSYWETEIRLLLEASLGRKSVRIRLNKKVCHAVYLSSQLLGDIGRKISIQGQPQTKTQDTIRKIMKVKNDWWKGLSGRTPAY
jgi:hypothetical protein